MSKELRVNNQIRAREVRVIGADGQQLGIMAPRDALRLAAESGVDLVEVAPNAKPPVCRIMDYGKYKYEQAKKEREARKKQRVITVKEVRMTPKTDEHDFQVKARNAEKFLKNGDKVKVTVRFRGREIVHASLAKEQLERMAELVKEVAVIERAPKLEGRNMIMILAPKQN
ncbi:MAG: translation initiation factor IF-3 [Firmicutes bacterium]|nr:translation initiation factor IF-3 [Bacillota bacterium]